MNQKMSDIKSPKRCFPKEPGIGNKKLIVVAQGKKESLKSLRRALWKFISKTDSSQQSCCRAKGETTKKQIDFGVGGKKN